LRALFVLGLVVLSGFLCYAKRYQILAKVWHWTHGNVVSVGKYQVPVPDHWVVEKIGSSSVQLVSIAAKERTDPILRANPVITASLLRNAVGDIDAWKKFNVQWREQKGLRVVEEHAIRFDDETLMCVGGNELHDVVVMPNTAVMSMECASTGTLSLAFLGEQSDLQEFYEIAAKISKQQ